MHGESQDFGPGFLLVLVSSSISEKYICLLGRWASKPADIRTPKTEPSKPYAHNPTTYTRLLITPQCQSSRRENIYEYVNVYLVISDQWRCWELHPGWVSSDIGTNILLLSTSPPVDSILYVVGTICGIYNKNIQYVVFIIVIFKCRIVDVAIPVSLPTQTSLLSVVTI